MNFLHILYNGFTPEKFACCECCERMFKIESESQLYLIRIGKIKKPSLRKARYSLSRNLSKAINQNVKAHAPESKKK